MGAYLRAFQPKAQQAGAQRLDHQHIRLVGGQRHAVGEPEAARQNFRAPGRRVETQQPARVRGLPESCFSKISKALSIGQLMVSGRERPPRNGQGEGVDLMG